MKSQRLRLYLLPLFIGLSFNATAKPKNFEIKSHILESNTLDLGSPGNSMGDLTVIDTVLMDAKSETAIGSAIFRKTILKIDPVSGATRSESFVEYTLAGGSIFVYATTMDDPTIHLINRPVTRAIVGGNGIYRGARGNVMNMPIEGRPGYFINKFIFL